jgi:hypothetical protein
MKHAVVLSLCFFPLFLIYVVMKLSLWFSSSVSEVNYVREDSKREHGPYLEDPYGDIDEKEEDY